jgi:hypothetical protein
MGLARAQNVFSLSTLISAVLSCFDNNLAVSVSVSVGQDWKEKNIFSNDRCNI